MKTAQATKALGFLTLLGKTGERVTVTTFRLLFAVYLEPGMSHSHYADELETTTANLHRHVIHLVNAGYAINAEGEQRGKGRPKAVVLTAEGKALCEQGMDKLFTS